MGRSGKHVIALFSLLAVLFMGSCGDDGGDGSSSPGTTEAGSAGEGDGEGGAEGEAEGGAGVVEVPDPCKVLSTAEISTIVGKPVTSGPTSDDRNAPGPYSCRWDLEAQPPADGQPSREAFVQVTVHGGNAVDVTRKSAERSIETLNEQQPQGATCTGTVEPVAGVEGGYELVTAATGGAVCTAGARSWIEREGFTMVVAHLDLASTAMADPEKQRATLNRLLAAVAENIDGAATVEITEAAPDPDAPDPCQILTSDQISAVVGKPVTTGPTDVTLDDSSAPQCRWDFESPIPAAGATVQQVYTQVTVYSGNITDRPRANAEKTIETQAKGTLGATCTGTLEIQPVTDVDGAFGLVSVGETCVSSSEVWLELDDMTISAVYVGAYDGQTDRADFRAISDKLIAAVADAI